MTTYLTRGFCKKCHRATFLEVDEYDTCTCLACHETYQLTENKEEE